jgi:hypothetical protein
MLLLYEAYKKRTPLSFESDVHDFIIFRFSNPKTFQKYWKAMNSKTCEAMAYLKYVEQASEL